MLHQCPTDLSLPDNSQVPQRLRQVTLVKWKLLAIQLNSYGSATNSRWKLHQYDMLNGASVRFQLVVDG